MVFSFNEKGKPIYRGENEDCLISFDPDKCLFMFDSFKEISDFEVKHYYFDFLGEQNGKHILQSELYLETFENGGLNRTAINEEKPDLSEPEIKFNEKQNCFEMVFFNPFTNFPFLSIGARFEIREKKGFWQYAFAEINEFNKLNTCIILGEPVKKEKAGD